MKSLNWSHDGTNGGRFVYISLVVLYYVQLAATSAPYHTSTCTERYITKLENITVGTELFQVTVTDADSNDDIRISMDPTTEQYVSITKSTGTSPLNFSVKLKNELDRETDPSPIHLLLTAKDKIGNTDPIKCDLYVGDVNDNKPMFTNLPYTWEIHERPFNYSKFTNIKATDKDSGTFEAVSYSITPTTQSQQRKKEYNETFAIHKTSGVVTVKKELDYEHNNYYQFKVTATDGGGLKSTTDLIIRVLDVQDTPPFFTRSSYRQQIQEEISIGSFVLQVNAEDGDRGIPNTVQYTITGGTCKQLFAISNDGKIRTQGRIDRDDNSALRDSGICKLTVEAHEINNTKHTQYGNTTAMTEVTIDVTDIDDNNPVFNIATVRATVAENTPANVPIQLSSNLSVSDKDQGPNAIILLSLHWLNGTKCTDFSVQPSRIPGSASVVIIVQNSKLLDYEQVKQLKFKVKATDENNRTYTDNVIVTLDITDVNDNNPEFKNNITTSFHLKENTASGTKLTTITASDKDTTSRGNLTYSLSGGDGRFVVNKTTGVITTKCSDCSSAFDREKYSDFTLSYTVKDEGDKPATISLTVIMDDVNDNIPFFYRDQFESFINENDAKYITNPVVKLDASDKDATQKNKQVRYSLLGDAAGLVHNFSCNNMTGEIFLTSALDYEMLTNSGGIVNLTAMVIDTGSPPLNSTTSVIIRVQDENDNYPLFTSNSYQANVSEDATSNTTTQIYRDSFDPPLENLLETLTYMYVENDVTGRERIMDRKRTHVINITATDDDGTTRNSDFHYYIVGGAFDKFAINSTTGEVYVQINSKLDREHVHLYNITMNAIDQGSPAHTSTATLSVTVTDVNDEPPTFQQQHYRASVKEGKVSDVLNITATDPDTDNKLQYSVVMVGGVDEKGNTVISSLIENYFEIDDDTGKVFATSITDRETAKRITLTIQVNDTNAVLNTPQTATVEVEITLLDVNDNSPKFDNSSYKVAVIENAPDNDLLLQVQATDRDENRTITYTLDDSLWPNQTFSLEPKTGKLRKVGKLDREAKDRGDLIITATDNGVPTNNSTVNVRVTVLDFNDNSPVFQTPNKTVKVLENVTQGYQILCMNATDIDKGPNSNVTYAISSGGSGNITINPITGCLSVENKLDRETVPTYNLILKALDNPVDPSTQKSSTTTLQIIIVDVNDNSPEFKEQKYLAKFPENENINKIVITVTATDKDKGMNSKITYSFENVSTRFQIDLNTGAISIKAELKDQVGNYSVVVIASDNGQPALSANVSVKLEITDVNNGRPEITNLPSSNTIDIFECVPKGTIFYNFTYTDKDHGLNSEAFFNTTAIDTNTANTFTVLQNGSLATTKKLNASKLDHYKINLLATDRGTPPLKSKVITIDIKVLDVNDHLPTFPDKPIQTAILENHTDINVVNVSATDIDRNSTPCYSILEGPWKDYFNISKNGGQIYNVQDFDYENTTKIQFVVSVEDCSVSIDTQNMCPPKTTTFPDRHANQTIILQITDVDDNPPVFDTQVISTGMRRKAEPYTTLNLHLRNSTYITDKDSPRNGNLSWSFENGGDIIPSDNLKVDTTNGIKPCGNATKVRYIFCIDGNGTISSNIFFKEDLFGYFMVPVRVSDKAGSDTAIIKVYLIGDSQILFMVVQDDKERVSLYKDKILSGYSTVTGYHFVYDWIEDHKDEDRVVTTKSDLYFHVVDKDGEHVLQAEDSVRLVDSKAEKLTPIQRNYHVEQIMSSRETAVSESDSSVKFYILVAVVTFLSLTLVVVIYAGLTTKSKYKQKLKAATIKSVDTTTEMVDGKFSVPGSNQYSKQANPLLNAEVEKIEAKYDAMSLSSDNSIDVNEVDDPQEHETVYDKMEEKEVTLDMFTEDTYTGRPEEDPLDAALRMHEQLKTRRDSQEFVDDTDDSDDPQGMQFKNYAFDDMESTEI